MLLLGFQNLGQHASNLVHPRENTPKDLLHQRTAKDRKMHPLPSRGRISLAFKKMFHSQKAILASLEGKGREKEGWGLVASG